MASPFVDIGHGITIAMPASGFTGQILDGSAPPLSRVSVKTTHQGTTGAHTFMPGDLYDAGELKFKIHFNPDTSPPIAAAAETITITWPAGATWVFSGFMTNYEGSWAEPGDDKMTADVTIKVSGEITITGG